MIQLPKPLKILCCFAFFTWTLVAQNPELTATGDQIYCPQSRIPIVTDFDLVNNGGTEINALYVQISSGYEQGTDLLELNASFPNITSAFDASAGKLTLSFSSGITTSEIINAVKAVTYSNSQANVSGAREFSITIGEANYLPSSGHYYEYVADNLITWQDARADAQARTYYSLQGYLATITSLDEAVLCGEQTQGAGWIGGTDEAEEGVWKWVTGPEGLAGGVEFWRGGPGGSTTTFAYWNSGEPNNTNGGEDYAHITAPGIGIEGSWNDLRTTGETSPDFQAKGYIVEYGGMPGDPELQIAASTTVRIPVTTATGDSRCGAGTVNLTATTTTGILNWYDAPTGGNLVHTGANFNPSISTTTNFYLAGEAPGCSTGIRRTVVAEVLPEVNTPGQITFSNCDEDGTPDGFTDFNLNSIIPQLTTNTAVDVVFYSTRFDADTNSGSNVLAGVYNNASGNTIYAYASNASGCFHVTEVNLQVSTTSFPDSFSYTLTTCDADEVADGMATFDLTQASSAMLNQFPAGQHLSVSYFRNETDALLQQNEILSQNSYRNETADEQILFVRVDDADSGSCFGVGPHLRLVVEPVPQFDVLNEGKFCSNASSFTLETSNAQDVYDYVWQDAAGTVVGITPQITVNQPGMYSVQAFTSYGCASAVKTIEVIASEAATITGDNIEVIQENGRNQIRVLDPSLLGVGAYEYALGDAIGFYQDAPVFDDVRPGFHTLYIRDKNGCGISSIEVAVLGFPEYFTPNNDGYHDRWGSLGLDASLYTQVRIEIFNRFGKLLKTLHTFDANWDGSTRDQPLPSDEYWYKVKLTRNDGSISTHSGHFTLKR